MNQLGRLLTGRIPSGDHQPGIGQTLNQSPILVTDLLAPSQAPSIFRSFTRPDHLDENSPGAVLFICGQGFVHFISITGQGAFYPADGDCGGARISVLLCRPRVV